MFDLSPGSRKSSRLVGREDELTLLSERYATAKAGNGNLVLVSGEAGIGKTALVRAFATDADHAGALVLTGHCYDLSTTPPYGPWLDLTEHYPSDAQLPVVPEVLKRGTGVGDLSSQVELFDIARDFFVAVAEQRPLVLVLEDLHWADQASLELLRYLARRLDQHRILIIATHREDTSRVVTELSLLLPVIIRESNAERVELHRLSAINIGEYLSVLYDLTPDDIAPLRDFLMRHTDGNPLFLREYLRMIEGERPGASTFTGWKTADLRDRPIPPLLMQIIKRRLDELSPECRALLEIAAIVGQEIPSEIWIAASQLPDDTFLGAIDEALASGFIVQRSTGNPVSFSHALVREALYHNISPPRRARMDVRIADMLVEAGSSEDDNIAFHYQRAGDRRAVDWLVRAGERANSVYAWKSAAQRFYAASELLRGEDDRLRERGWLLYRAARLLRFSEHQLAIEMLSESESIGIQSGSEALTAYSKADRGQIRVDMSDYERGVAEIGAGNQEIDRLSEHPAEWPEFRNWVSDVVIPDATVRGTPDGTHVSPHVNPRRGMLAMSLVEVGRYREAFDIAISYLDNLNSIETLDRDLLSSHADASTALSMALALFGNPDDARAHLAIAHRLRRSIGHLVTVGVSAIFYLSIIHLPYRTHFLEDRRQFHREMDELSTRAEGALPVDVGTWLSNSSLQWIEGKWEQVEEFAPAAMKFNSSYLHHNGALALGLVARAKGDAERAWSYVDHLLPAGLSTVPGSTNYFFCHQAHELAARLSMDRGDLARARQWIDRYDHWLTWSEAALGAAESQLLWSNFHRLNDDQDASMASALAALEHAKNPDQPLAQIVALRLLGELQTERGMVDEAETHLQESLSLADACAAPFERALTLLALAELRAATGDVREARTILDEVESICQPLGAKPTLERVDRLRRRLAGRRPRSHHPSGLTSREVDVLRLLAQGMTDKEIADELFISHHTVMRHVSHILGKLEVDSRSGAAAEAVRLGLA